MFHVACLKKALGQQVTPSTNLSPLDEEGKLVLILEEFLDVREKRLRNKLSRNILSSGKTFQSKIPHQKEIRFCNILVCSCLMQEISGRDDCNVPFQVMTIGGRLSSLYNSHRL